MRARVLPTTTIAAMATASWLAIGIAVAVLADVGEEDRERRARVDDKRWAEVDEFLPADATVEQAVGKIRRAGMVTSQYVGYAGSPSAVYEAYVHLGRLANDEQLRALVEDEEPAVRVYAFLSLSNRQLGGVAYDVLLAHAADDAVVRTQSGCIGDEATVFAAMLERVEHRLSEAQLANVRALRESVKPHASASRPTGFFR